MATQKKDKKVEIRLSQEDYDMLKIAAYTMGNTVSGMMRMMAQTSINAVKMQINSGKITDENIKAILND